MPVDEGWLCGFQGYLDGDDGVIFLWDCDRRRRFTVTRPLPELTEGDDAQDQQWYTFRAQAIQFLLKYIEELGPDVTLLQCDEDGTVITSTDAEHDCTLALHYPSIIEYQIPAKTIKTAVRSDLTEIDRLARGVDVVSYSSSDTVKTGAFKNYVEAPGLLGFWTEMHVRLRLPPHPNILPVDCLVLEEVTGSKGVVGFISPLMPNGDFSQRRGPDMLFKMKWLKQLMQTVDDLNLRFGLVHQDIAPRNLLHDPKTDNIILFDFDLVTRFGAPPTYGPIRGMEDKDPAGPRNDVKAVMIAVYDIITRDPAFDNIFIHTISETAVEDPKKWVKHPEVQLDDGLTALDYYNELMAWVVRRRAAVDRDGVAFTHYSQAPEHFEWPEKATPAPIVTIKHHRGDKMVEEQEDSTRIYRKFCRDSGLPVVEWERPAASQVDRSRRLLATGKYADEEAGQASQPLIARPATSTAAGAGGQNAKAAAAATSADRNPNGSPSAGTTTREKTPSATVAAVAAATTQKKKMQRKMPAAGARVAKQSSPVPPSPKRRSARLSRKTSNGAVAAAGARAAGNKDGMV